MTSLAELSQKRLSGQLPTFAGLSLVEQLENGRAAAEAALRKYVPNFHFSVADADKTMHELDSWAERNQAELAEALDPATNPSDTLPDKLRLLLGAKRTGDFIVASFTAAALGLGPWQAGEVARLAQPGTVVSGQLVDRTWAEVDAEMRLQTFGLIVRMDQDGSLKSIFGGGGDLGVPGASGLGLAPATIALIAIVTAIIAAAIVIFVVWDRHLERNNRLMRDICERAQAEGRDEVVTECVRASEGLQLGIFGGELLKKIATGALVFGGGYLVVKHLLPRWVASRRGANRGGAR